MALRTWKAPTYKDVLELTSLRSTIHSSYQLTYTLKNKDKLCRAGWQSNVCFLGCIELI